MNTGDKYFIAWGIGVGLWVIFTLLFVVWCIRIAITLAFPTDHTSAVLQMDGRGWFRVSDYRIDGNCVRFVNGLGEKEVFCGSFGVTEKKDFNKLKGNPY
jgi:hypothetical protein